MRYLRIYPLVLIKLMTPIKFVPDWEFGATWPIKMMSYVKVEDDIHLRLLNTSILDMYTVFDQLVCFLNGIWMHPYTIIPAKLAPDLGIQGHLWSENDVITSWLIWYPPQTTTYTKCLIHWYAVSRAFRCTLNIPPAKLAPDLEIQGHLWIENDVITSWLKLISTSDHCKHPYYIRSSTMSITALLFW